MNLRRIIIDKYFAISALVCLLPLFGKAQTISGIVKDNEGERLPYAHIVLLPDSSQTTTDMNGHFIIKSSKGHVSMTIAYAGFETFRTNFKLKNDTTLSVYVKPKTNQLAEVTVSEERFKQSDMLQTNRMSSVRLNEKEINSIPVLGGEADLIRVIQLLPGVSKGIDGSTDLFIRGGAADQNLVLLDGAPVYNTGHLFGFLSVFNPDVLQSVESMNGTFPADYGGRLSSILDIHTKSEFADKTHVQGNIGLLASRLKIDQPLIKNKLNMWVAGRRTYIDQVMKLTGEELPYYFYDLNFKLNYQPTLNNQIEFSTYSGKDVLNYKRQPRENRRDRNITSNFIIDNSTQSLRWKNKLDHHWNSSLTLTRSAFRYNIQNTFEDNRLLTKSDIEDLGAKWIMSTDSLKDLAFKGGIEFIHHRVSPNVIATSGEISQLLESTTTSSRICMESSAFAQLDGFLSTRWRWSSGLRISSGIVSSKTYVNPEPRLAIRYTVNANTAIKASYSRMAQYLHRVSSAAVAFPTDIWYPVTNNVKPQTADQISIAYQHMINKPGIFFSAELYYKQLNQLMGYQEGTNLFLNNDFESKLIQGKGRAYGFEFLIKKESGRLKGWISYTLSWSQRLYKEVNSGEWFYARYDRRHNGAVVANYTLTKRLSVSAVWEFISGSRFTPVIGQYVVPAPSLGGVNLIPVYAGMNSVKLADTHRLDLGLKYKSKPGRRFQSEWFAGIYNTYNRAAPIGIFIESNDDGSYSYQQPGLFGLLPFISYGFKF